VIAVGRASYVATRLLQMIPTFLLIGGAVFVLARLLPGDFASAMLGDRATEEAVQRLTKQLGLDLSIGAQFVAFLQGVLRGELGNSLAFRVPVTALIAERLPVTLMLTGLATLFAIALAVPLAFVAALWANRWPDLLIRTIFQVGLSSPIFFVGLVLLTVFAAWFRLFPVGGYGEGFLEHLHHLFLPALTLALSFAAVIMRSLRASILQVLRAEFIDFARAKGLSSRVVLVRHVMRNALIATVTLIGLHIGQLLGGAVITESVFAVPGAGRLMVDSIFARDYPVIQGLTLVLALLVSIAFLATDLVQMWLDPRVTR
jgi:peptide/nickel transport system permease protein